MTSARPLRQTGSSPGSFSSTGAWAEAALVPPDPLWHAETLAGVAQGAMIDLL